MPAKANHAKGRIHAAGNSNPPVGSIGGMIIAVDLDGVCADFYCRMREIAAEWLECDIKKLSKKVSLGLPEWGLKDLEEYNSLHRFAVTQRALFKTSGIIPGARRYLRQFSNEGARIRILTHRLFIDYFHRIAVEQTVDWLDANGIPYSDLCFMKDKEQVGADVYIDDSPENVQRLRARNLYTICFANSTNRHVLEPRAKTWADVYHLVHVWAAGRNGYPRERRCVS